ncbi:uncharacterized protein PAC_00387 [Phialocephala subalpina]|uniref:2EXR domain-containing protein n=1 Tax=Phialocephala subalpina TaxID=576137 RepID=A0A1L7WCK6_9HELO|nr:uncharacterized protein PAC_00387 [Phialocephala subalpina]
MPPRRRAAPPAPPRTLTSFTIFSKLPSEIRFQIWNLRLLLDANDSMKNIIVPIEWDSRQRSFMSDRKPPALLHTCKESRAEAQKIYQLRFASSPEFARIYFSYEHDILLINWPSMGPAPGRIGRKLMDKECKDVRCLMISEQSLLTHAEENLHELERFTGLRDICVLCDPDDIECGDEYGSEGMMQLAKVLDEGLDEEPNYALRTQTWPELVCLRNDEGIPACSRHWWFDGWNQRAKIMQKDKWPETLATSLLLTHEDDAEHDAVFLLNMLFMHATGQPFP